MWPAQAPPITRPLTSKLRADAVPKPPVEQLVNGKPASPSSPVPRDCSSWTETDPRTRREDTTACRESGGPIVLSTSGDQRSADGATALAARMTMTKTFLRQCIIVLGIFLCYAQAMSSLKRVDCEKFPYYKTCRGTMTRKRAMIANSLRVPGCDGTRDDPNCTEMKFRPFEERQYIIPNYISYAAIPRSKLWISLLENNLNTDDAYSANYERRHDKRKDEENDKYTDWRIPQMEARFLSDLENSDNDY